MPPAFLTILGHHITLMSIQHRAPNKRLKLTGSDRSKGSGVLCPGGHGLSSNTLALASESPAA